MLDTSEELLPIGIKMSSREVCGNHQFSPFLAFPFIKCFQNLLEYIEVQLRDIADFLQRIHKICRRQNCSVRSLPSCQSLCPIHVSFTKNKFWLQIHAEIISIQSFKELANDFLFFCTFCAKRRYVDHNALFSSILCTFPCKICIFNCLFNIHSDILYHIYACRNSHSTVWILVILHIREPAVAHTQIFFESLFVFVTQQHKEEIRIQTTSRTVIWLTG